ncbi:MAG TPA: hypothetical protein VGM65_01055 [Candidatus Udaeobacter sp.]
MKAISPTVIALVLWLLFWASHAFALVKPPYPQKAQPPVQILVISDGGVGPAVGTASKPK